MEEQEKIQINNEEIHALLVYLAQSGYSDVPKAVDLLSSTLEVLYVIAIGRKSSDADTIN